MNNKVVLGILGAAIVVGGIIYFVSRDNADKATESESVYDDNKKKDTDIVEHTKFPEKKEEISFSSTKAGAAEKMSERHEEAKKMMKESVDNIFSDEEVGETKNAEIKKKMFDDLGNI